MILLAMLLPQLYETLALCVCMGTPDSFQHHTALGTKYESFMHVRRAGMSQMASKVSVSVALLIVVAAWIVTYRWMIRLIAKKLLLN